MGESEQINMINEGHYFSMDDWSESVSYSRGTPTSSYTINNFSDEKDMITELYGENHSLEHILEIAKRRDFSYQRRNKDQSKD